MADYTVNFTKHGELAANERVHIRFTFGIDESNENSLQQNVPLLIVNGGPGDLYFDITWFDGTPPRDIAAGDDDTYMIMPGRELLWKSYYTANEVKLISDSGCKYSVMAVY